MRIKDEFRELSNCLSKSPIPDETILNIAQCDIKAVSKALRKHYKNLESPEYEWAEAVGIEQKGDISC